MKKIYIYNKDQYAALRAAYDHLKLDMHNHIIENRWIKEGHFYYLGIDEWLNEVYLLYSSKNNLILTNLLNGFANLYNEDIEIISVRNK